jgi:hypothetical protein
LALCKPEGLCYRRLLACAAVVPGSSAVEQPAVNRLVAGSNPARGAKLLPCCRGGGLSSISRQQATAGDLIEELLDLVRGKVSSPKDICPRSRGLNDPKGPAAPRLRRHASCFLASTHLQASGIEIPAPPSAFAPRAYRSGFRLQNLENTIEFLCLVRREGFDM